MIDESAKRHLLAGTGRLILSSERAASLSCVAGPAFLSTHQVRVVGKRGLSLGETSRLAGDGPEVR
jgi:hypothetical protein